MNREARHPEAATALSNSPMGQDGKSARPPGGVGWRGCEGTKPWDRRAESGVGAARSPIVADGASSDRESPGAPDPLHLLRVMNTPALLLDRRLRVRAFTPAIACVIRIADGDVGRSIERVPHDLGPGFIEAARKVIRTGIEIDRDARGLRGEWMRMRILPYAHRDGRISGIVITFAGVTGPRNACEAARLAVDLCASMSRELSAQREECETMFSIVAHDLKRPLLALDGLLTLVQHAADPASPRGTDEAGRGLLARALVECRRMGMMLTDLESVARLRHREVEYERVEPRSWLESLLEPFREAAGSRRVRLRCTTDAGVSLIPRTIIDECVANLVENALKYGCSNESPCIDVSCRVAAREGAGGTIEIEVTDNGNGIAPEDHHKVFEPFRRLDPHAAPGSGIGLMAVRRLMSKIGGDVRLESRIGSGATFTLRCPLGAAAPDESGTHPGRRLLLVEADPLDAGLIERALRAGHRVVRVSTICEAESRLRSEAFDLVVLELSLPDGHGFELVRRVRTGLGLATPMVVVTGHAEGLPPDATDALVQGFIRKSDLSDELLTATVAAALAHADAAPSVAGRR